MTREEFEAWLHAMVNDYWPPLMPRRPEPPYRYRTNDRQRREENL
jgi:hypothetical protein